MLIRLSALAPAPIAASAGSVMSPTLGVSLMITGTLAWSMTQPVISRSTLGSAPTAEPMPRSHMPWGQPKLSSRASAPVSSAFLMISAHSSLVSTIREATSTFFG